MPVVVAPRSVKHVAVRSKTIGRVLKDVRESRDLSISAVARMVGVTPGALSRLESDDRAPSFSLVKAVAQALGASLDEIVAAMDGGPTPNADASAASVEETLRRVGSAAREIVDAMAAHEKRLSRARKR